MIKPAFLFILLIALTAASCKVDEPNFKGYNIIDPAESYLPYTKGTTWTYMENVAGKEPATFTLTVTDKTIKADGKYFVEIKRSGGGDTSRITYYNFDDHEYIVKQVYFLSDSEEQLILKDTATVDYAWISKYNDSGLYQNNPAQIRGHVVAKDLTMDVAGKTYTQVIRTQVELQHNYDGTIFRTFRAFDYYFVKGIGIIQIDVQADGKLEAVTRLVSYRINGGKSQ
jgi:hypothetical protein